VRSYFIFSLFPFNTSFLSTTPHLLCLVKAGDRQREKEETLMSLLICRRECVRPNWTHFFSRCRCLAHTPSSLRSCQSPSSGMMNWEESESPGFCFIITSAKVHPLFFSFRLCCTLAYGVYLSTFLKDMVCSLRPYTPLVTRLCKGQSISSSVPRLISRLAVGNYHLEYGFPSTHSANCVPITIPGHVSPRSPS